MPKLRDIDGVQLIGELDANIVALLYGFNGAAYDRLRSAADNGDALATLTLGVLRTMAVSMVFNGATFDRARGGGDNADALTTLALGVQRISNVPMLLVDGTTFDRQRTPKTFKPFASTAITAGTGATIWTPAAGKKFRLMGFWVSSSVAGQLIFGDNLVGTVIARSPLLQAAVVPHPMSLGNGILSAAANNVLKIDGPTGNVAGMVYGTEE